jgi:hypothetical protein
MVAGLLVCSEITTITVSMTDGDIGLRPALLDFGFDEVPSSPTHAGATDNHAVIARADGYRIFHSELFDDQTVAIGAFTLEPDDS